MSARRRPVVAYADTNLFVALLVGPDHVLHEPALDIFRRVASGELSLVLPSIIVAELVYVAGSLLRWTREVTALRLTELLAADGLIVSEAAVITRALGLFAERRRLDFADAYLVALALELGPAVVASLDADIGSVPGVVRIAS